jgi:hypothetical protein
MGTKINHSCSTAGKPFPTSEPRKSNRLQIIANSIRRDEGHKNADADYVEQQIFPLFRNGHLYNFIC